MSNLKDEKFDISDIPGKMEERVFVGGNYTYLSLLRSIRNWIKQAGFTPILADDFDVPKNKINEYDQILVHNSKYALFEITTDAGHLPEIERAAKDYSKLVLCVYQVRNESDRSPPPQVSKMLTTLPDLSMFGYVTVEELEAFLVRVFRKIRGEGDVNKERFKRIVAREIDRRAHQAPSESSLQHVDRSISPIPSVLSEATPQKAKKVLAPIEVYSSLFRAINYVLRTFDSDRDRDIEGLSMRVAFLDRIVELGFYNLDMQKAKEVSTKEEAIEWMDEYLRKIKEDLWERIKDYSCLLSREKKVSGETPFILKEKEAKQNARDVYRNGNFEKIFFYCYRCPVRFYCFCQFKTLLVCVFGGQAWQESLLLKFLEKELPIKRKLRFKRMVQIWLSENIHIGEHTGFPYLIRGSVNEYLTKRAVSYDQLPEGDISKDNRSINVDPFVTIALIQLLSNPTFSKQFKISDDLKKISEAAIQSVKDLQNTSRTELKEYLLPPDGFYTGARYPIYGSWNEGFWGGIKIQRAKSTADIGRILYTLEGASDTVERVLEFILTAFMRDRDDPDEESDLYILDDSTFRTIDVAAVSNISGTISALRFLLALRPDDLKRMIQNVHNSLQGHRTITKALDDKILKELDDPEIFIARRLKWLLSQQRVDNAFPILSKNFVKTVESEDWWFKPEKAEELNVSLNNSIETVFLLLEYIDHGCEHL